MKGKQLYVGNLNDQITKEHLIELFSEFGDVLKVRIMKGSGFGFVEMKNPDEAELVKLNLDDSFLFNKKIIVQDARPKSNCRRNRRNKFKKKA